MYIRAITYCQKALIFSLLCLLLVTPTTIVSAQGSTAAAIGGGAGQAIASCEGQKALNKVTSKIKSSATGAIKSISGIGGNGPVPTKDSGTRENTDLANDKECLMDTITILLRETLIRKITSSIVTWINSGFEGSPAFVTNMEDFLLDTADEAFGTYIYNDSNFAHLCSPFEFDIRFALALSYSTDAARPVCTLSSIVDNVETAIDDLSVEWDWDVYETITTDPSGNIFSSYIQSQENISNFITGTVNQNQEEVDRNEGFLSFKKCTTGVDANRYGGDISDPNSVNGQLAAADARAGRNQVEECEIVTPGSVINQTLATQLNLDVERLALADEFNEIVGALMGQLAQQAFGRDGVSGLTERSGGSNAFVSSYNQDALQSNSQFSSDLSQTTADTSDTYTDYVATQNETIQTLLQAKIKVSEAFACYESKYNTFVDADGQVLTQAEVASQDPATLTRATFVNIVGYNAQDIIEGEIPAFLTPSQALAQAEEYQSIITRIDNGLVEAESKTELARDAAELTARYQSRLTTSSGPAETQGLFTEYSQAVAGISVDPSLADEELSAVQTFTDQAINGTVTFGIDGQERAGGAVNDLATCQTFNQVVVPQA